jgi:hypothetical protein
MSKYIDELIADINGNPSSWKRYKDDGIQKGHIHIYNLGGKPIFSVIEVKINGYETPMTYVDKWRTESAVRRWFKVVNLNKLSEI